MKYKTITKISSDMVQKRQTKTGNDLKPIQETLADVVDLMMNDLSFPFFDNACKNFDLLEKDGEFFVRIYRPWNSGKMLRPIFPIPGS